MKTIYFLSIAEVLEIHSNQIELYGGSPGMREQGLLEGAVHQAQSSFGDEYLHKDVFEMAAAYLYHLVQNHPFIDGNKRVGLASAIVFLYLNGIELNVDLDTCLGGKSVTQLNELIISIASSKTKKDEIAKFLKANSV